MKKQKKEIEKIVNKYLIKNETKMYHNPMRGLIPIDQSTKC